MTNPIIYQRLAQYSIRTSEDEENALKEILQEIALYALSTTDFFEKAFFQGGTCLRILYDLPRFSEDLDFLLKANDHDFQWEPYIHQIKKVFELYGIFLEIKDRGEVASAIKKLFLKDRSIGKLLDLSFYNQTHKKLRIKLEIDTNPPIGSKEDIKYLDFPIDYAIVTQDLSSNFSGKCHALLCRPYTKGRDWFDFSWYISKKAQVNFTFLKNALDQYGPWKNKNINLTSAWLADALEKKIKEAKWDEVKKEISRFINQDQAAALSLWSANFFLNKVEKLRAYSD